MKIKVKPKDNSPLILRLILSNRCRLCMKTIPINGFVCDECKTEHLKIQPGIFKNQTFINRYYDNLTSPFFYAGSIRQGIVNFKYKNFKRGAEFFTREMAHSLESDFPDEEPDIITGIPMTKLHYRERNFNHTKILAKGISKIFGIPVCHNLLIKIKDTPTQVGSSAKERQKNLKNAFKVNPKYNVKNKTVLLCDDVLTTGSTLDECAKALKKAGAKKVLCVTAALNNQNY